MVDKKKVAVITGAASGIGLALSEACLQRNMHVVMADISENDLVHAVSKLERSGLEIFPVQCDVSNEQEVNLLAKQTVSRFDKVDLLINNAGISGKLAPVWEQESEQIRQVIETNLFGVINGIKAFLPFMFAQQHRAKLVNMASVYGLVSGSQVGAYAMSKHAVVSLSESLFFDLQRLNKPVDVSVVCPSFVNTQLLLHSKPKESNAFHQMMIGFLERCRSPEEVAEHILDELNKNTFYIMPDKEVKQYCDQRHSAVIEQHSPLPHSLEKVMAALSNRA